MYNWICVSTFLNWVRAALHFSGATFDSLVAMAVACPPTACLSNNPIWSSLLLSSFLTDQLPYIQKSNKVKRNVGK